LFTKTRNSLCLQILIPNSSAHDMSVRLIADVVILYQQAVWENSAIKQEQEDQIALQDHSICSDR